MKLTGVTSPGHVLTSKTTQGSGSHLAHTQAQQAVGKVKVGSVTPKGPN